MDAEVEKKTQLRHNNPSKEKTLHGKTSDNYIYIYYIQTKSDIETSSFIVILSGFHLTTSRPTILVKFSMQNLYNICRPKIYQLSRLPIPKNPNYGPSHQGIISIRSCRFLSSIENRYVHETNSYYKNYSLLALDYHNRRRNRSYFGNITSQMRTMSGSSNTDQKDEKSLREKYEPRERKFKTVYGHIAGLEWGSPDAPNKVLCIHGWLDNAGSFERLIPYLLDHGDNANKYHFVAIDHPGCGLSSHKPPGSQYTMFTVVIEMRRVVKELGWDKLQLLSHSMGSQLSFWFSCLYPYQVTNLISIDIRHPLTAELKNWAPILVSSIEEQLKIEEVLTDDPTTNIQVPVYSREDAIKRLMDGHNNSLTRESAEVMLKRGARKERWGYTFNRDLRHRIMYVELRPDYALLRRYMDQFFSSNLLVILANQSFYKPPEEITATFDEIFKRNCKIFQKFGLDGTHHLHMNNPDTVSEAICKFWDHCETFNGSDSEPSNGSCDDKSKL